MQELHGLYTADDHQGALEALGRFCDLYETGELPEYHNTHTGGALSVGLGLTLCTTGPSGAFTMICRPAPVGGARTDRPDGCDPIGAFASRTVSVLSTSAPGVSSTTSSTRICAKCSRTVITSQAIGALLDR